MKIIKYPNEILRQKAKDYLITRDKKIVNSIIDTLRELPYCSALTAPEVGISFKIIVIKEGYEYKTYFNPKLLHKEGKQILEEGCLCLPDVWKKIERPRIIKVEYKNIHGKKHTRQIYGQPAGIFMHCLDHLNGKLIIDY
jgi:peptide deformylase